MVTTFSGKITNQHSNTMEFSESTPILLNINSKKLRTRIMAAIAKICCLTLFCVMVLNADLMAYSTNATSSDVAADDFFFNEEREYSLYIDNDVTVKFTNSPSDATSTLAGTLEVGDTVDFDTDKDAVPNQYTDDGFVFTGTGVQQGFFGQELLETPNVSQGQMHTTTVVAASGADFILNSVDLTDSDAPDGEDVTVTGYLNGALVATETIFHLTDSFQTFNLPALDNVVVDEIRLTYSRTAFGGRIFQIDNFDTSAPVSNTAPTFNSSTTASINENTATNTVVLDVNADDGDGGGNDSNITYALSGDDAGDFTIDTDDGEIRFNSSPDFENPADVDTDNDYQITVTADDGEGSNNTATQDITITVTDVSEGGSTGTLDGASVTFEELSQTKTIDGSDDDLNHSGSPQATYNVEFEISGGLDNGYVDIDGDRLVIGQRNGASITVSDLNFTFSGGTFSTITGATINTTDSDADNYSGVSVSVSGGNKVTLSGMNTTSFSSTTTVKSIVIDITSTGSAPSNTAPTDITLNTNTVNQSDGTNAIVGSLSTTDADVGDTHSYSLVAGAGDDDNADFNISGSNLQANDATALAAGTYSVRIQTDDGTESFQKAFNISVVDDINDPPVLTATATDPAFTEGGTTVKLYSGVTVSTVESGQVMTGMTLTVTNLSDGASEILGIDGSDLVLTDGNSVFTATNNLTVTVSVAGPTATVNFTGANLSPAQMQTLVDGLAYRNTSDNPTTGSNRVVTITQVSDDGGTANGGNDTSALNLQSAVSLTAVNDAPVASNVTFSGTLEYGYDLTATYDYSDVEENAESGSSYHWYRSDDNQGTGKVSITDATTATYRLTNDDIGKYISFEVTPNDGNTAGSAVESDFSGPVVSPFAGGQGTEADPYQIATAVQLDYVRDFLDKHFIQTADIDLGVSPWTDGEGWEPIYVQNSRFTGHFDGNERLISNLKINRPSEQLVGLFGNNNGKLINIVLEDVDIAGRNFTGALVGNNYSNGSIENSRASGYVAAETTAGGLAGQNSGTIQHSSSSVNIEGLGSIGGLVGINGYDTALIENSYAMGDVSGILDGPFEPSSLGGLVGSNRGSIIRSSYATGSVTGTSGLGGLVGSNRDNGALIEHAYSSGAVSATGDEMMIGNVGGLVGSNRFDAQINQSYTFSKVSGVSHGGLSGRNGATITDSYWDVEMSGQTSSDGGTGLTTSEMQTKATFTDAGWDFASVWQIDDSQGGSITYPYLQSIPQAPAPGYRVTTPPVASDFSTGDGPYQNQTYIFDTADFGFSDADSDLLVHLRITTVPGNGTLYVDANDNDAYNTGEELAAGDTADKGELDAGHLQYVTSGSDADSFSFEVFDGLLYSANTYTASMNIIGEPVISFVEDSSEGDESVVTKEFKVSLSNAFETDITVVYAVSGTAENGSDYTLADGTLTVPSGDTEGVITIADITDDAVLEADETVIVTLSNPVHASLGTENVHTYTIIDNDAAAVTLADAAGNEDDGPITITATLDHAVQGGFTVDVSTANGTARTGGNDYKPVSGLTLTFAGAAGETQVFEIEPTADSIQESDETLTASLDNLDNTSLAVDISDNATVTISNDDAVPVFTSSDSITVDEKKLPVATIVANDPDAGASLSYSITGGADAALFSIEATSGVLSFKNAPDYENPGDGNKDNDYELIVEADDGTNTVLQNLIITVVNVNEAPVVDAGISDQTANENIAYTLVIPDDAFADEDLNDDLALTVTNLPAGLNFDPSTGTISGTPTDGDLGANTITVTATDKSGASVSTTFILTVLSEVPAKIVLSTPENGSNDIEVNPTLTWEAAGSADTYEVRVATDDNFTNPIVSDTGLTNTLYEINKSLDVAATYYWQVRGLNQGGAGEWSTVFSFTTIPEVPGEVVLRSPVDNKSSVDRTVALAWDATDRAASYKVQVAEDETFQQITTETTVSDTELQLNNELPDNTTYSWRVRAENSGGHGAWSQAWKFTTAANAPILTFPNTGEKGISIAPKLSWLSGYKESSFQVRLATDENFQNIVADTLVASDNMILKGLENDTDYYWTVRMNTDLNSSPWAVTRNFTTRMETVEESVDVEIVFGNASDGGGNGSAGKSLDTYDYRLVGLPGEKATSVENLFAGEYGNDWRVFEDNGAKEDFLKEHSKNNPLSFNAGTGYWVLSKEPVNIDKNIASVDISENDTYSIALKPGWNIISNPFNSTADWKQIQTFNNLSALLYGYERSFYESDKMEPFQAYYVYNDSGSEFMLEIPYTSLDKRSAEEENKSKEKPIARKIHLSINHVGDDITSNLSMVYPLDTKRLKEATHYSPPLTLSRFGAAIIEEENTHREKILRSVGDTYSEESNHYSVEVKSADRSEIRWQPRFEGMDNTTGVLIVDPKSGRSKILADGEAYSFMSDEGHKKFEVYTGNLLKLEGIKEGLIPEQFSLEQNYPNPFNPTTTIRFGLDVQDHVQLDVFNILGQKVHTLVNENRTAGWHRVSFDASRLSSGTYFYRLIIGQNVITRKMTLIK